MKHSSTKSKGYRRHFGRKYRRLAAAVAGAFVLASGGLPGLPAAVAHAATPTPAAPAAPAAALKTPDAATAMSGKAPAEYQKALSVVATAYAPGAHDNAQWGNKTYLGTQVRPGIIAVDPRVIPLRSKVFIQYPDGHGEYAVAEDTGGAIKGNRIDIAMQSVKEAQNFGMQNVKVFVVSTPRGAGV